MFKKLLILSCLCPLLSWAADNDQLPPWLRPGPGTDPRPSGYPTMGSHDPVPHKMEFFHDTRHWYICFDGGKFYMHDPECPCHISSKYITYDLDEHNNPVKNSYKLTQQVHPAWDYHP